MSATLERPKVRVETPPPSPLEKAEVAVHELPTAEPRPAESPYDRIVREARAELRHGFACSCARCYCSGGRGEYLV